MKRFKVIAIFVIIVNYSCAQSQFFQEEMEMYKLILMDYQKYNKNLNILRYKSPNYILKNPKLYEDTLSRFLNKNKYYLMKVDTLSDTLSYAAKLYYIIDTNNLKKFNLEDLEFSKQNKLKWNYSVKKDVYTLQDTIFFRTSKIVYYVNSKKFICGYDPKNSDEWYNYGNAYIGMVSFSRFIYDSNNQYAICTLHYNFEVDYIVLKKDKLEWKIYKSGVYCLF